MSNDRTVAVETDNCYAFDRTIDRLERLAVCLVALSCLAFYVGEPDERAPLRQQSS